MQSCWLSKKGQSSCILFFTGWGMDPVPFRPVPADNHDLLLLYDYQELDRNKIEEIIPINYHNLYLIAWSMGVWVAADLLGAFRDRFSATVAINGTTTPIDDRYGIEEKVYADMIRGLTTSTLNVFYQSMFDDKKESEIFFRNRPRRPVDAILNELIMLRRSYLERGPAEDIFTRKLVGSRDRIFPARCQVRNWGRDKCTVLKFPHFPFYMQPSWHDFLREA